MPLRKIIIYLLFGLTVVYGFQYHFFSDKDSKASEEQPPDSGVSGQPLQAGAGVRSGAPPTRSAGYEAQLAWARDPFRKNSQANNTVSRHVSTAPRMPDKPRISAISRTGNEVMVIADGRILKIGQKTGPWLLVAVEDNAALFDGPGGAVRVKLGGSR